MTKEIAVFGATGYQGGSVLRSLIPSNDFNVRAITRHPHSQTAKKLAKLKNITIHQADLNDPISLDKAIKGCYGVFLVTDYWENPTKDYELQHGINLIDSAVKHAVSHVVFSGLENVSSIIGKRCLHFDNKEKIEQYGMKFSSKINFTSIRLSSYYQNLTNIFLKKVKHNEFNLIMPMSDKPLYCMNVDDLGECVHTIFRNPHEFKSKIIGVAGDYLEPNEIVAILNKHLHPNKFVYANLSLRAYLEFDFQGVEDLTNMFEYYQSGKMVRDLNLTKELNPNTLSFSDWVSTNKLDILNNLPKN